MIPTRTWLAALLCCTPLLQAQSLLTIHRTDGEAESFALETIRSLRFTASTEVEDASAPLASAFALQPNFPNPFNPETTIVYTLERPLDLKVEIHDLRGARVATLADGLHAAGRHELRWTGRNGEGRAVASGVYLLVAQHEEQSRTRKLLLLK